MCVCARVLARFYRNLITYHWSIDIYVLSQLVKQLLAFQSMSRLISFDSYANALTPFVVPPCVLHHLHGWS